MESEIIPNANFNIQTVAYNPNTLIMEISLAGDDAQAALGALFSRLPASIQAKLTRANVNKTASRVQTAANRVGRRPGGRR